MQRQCERVCDTHVDAFECAEAVLHRYDSGSFGIIIHDGGTSSYTIRYCPWCGSALPDPEFEEGDAPEVRRIDVD